MNGAERSEPGSTAVTGDGPARDPVGPTGADPADGPPGAPPGDPGGDPARGHPGDPDGGGVPAGGESTDPRGIPAAAVRSRRGALRARRRRRRFYLLTAMAALCLPALLAVGWFAWQLDPPTATGPDAVVEIPPGANLSGIGDRLDRAGVVGSAFAFTTWARVTRHAAIRSGSYRIPRNAGIREALRVLDRGPVDRGQAVVSAGITLAEVAAQVDQARGLSGARFLELARSGTVRSRYQPAGVDSLEGLLAPGEYRLDLDDDEASLLRRMVERFDARADAAGLDGASRLGVTPYQAVIVASLVQAEAGVESDRPLIAAVVYNRLRTGTPLQIDATVVYARGRRDGPITQADLDLDSPYNTYRVAGLPPTPIATVGPASLAAALDPADVPYRYYVLADRDGRHAFATTYEEHERNVAEARRRGVLP